MKYIVTILHLQVRNYRWLVSRGLYTIPLLFISLITPAGNRPDTDIAYTPLQNRSIWNKIEFDIHNQKNGFVRCYILVEEIAKEWKANYKNWREMYTKLKIGQDNPVYAQKHVP